MILLSPKSGGGSGLDVGPMNYIMNLLDSSVAFQLFADSAGAVRLCTGGIGSGDMMQAASGLYYGLSNTDDCSLATYDDDTEQVIEILVPNGHVEIEGEGSINFWKVPAPDLEQHPSVMLSITQNSD